MLMMSSSISECRLHVSPHTQVRQYANSAYSACKVKAIAMRRLMEGASLRLRCRISMCKRLRVLTSLTSIPAQVTPRCRVNKCQPAGLQSICTDVLEESRATPAHHCPIGQDGLPPGAITQQCNVYRSQSSSNYVNESGGGRPFLLFKLWSGARVCIAVLCNSTESSTTLNNNCIPGSWSLNDNASLSCYWREWRYSHKKP